MFNRFLRKKRKPENAKSSSQSEASARPRTFPCHPPERVTKSPRSDGENRDGRNEPKPAVPSQPSLAGASGKLRVYFVQRTAGWAGQGRRGEETESEKSTLHSEHAQGAKGREVLYKHECWRPRVCRADCGEGFQRFKGGKTPEPKPQTLHSPPAAMALERIAPKK